VYLALEYLDADTLAQVLTRKRSLATDVAVGIAREVALALKHAHDRHVIHCDIKPGNVLICRDGRVLISDFGVALAQGQPALNDAGRVLGTPRYMAPEQARGESIDPRTDIFSLGVVLYEALAGIHAFPGGTSVDVIRQVVEVEPLSLQKLRPDLPHALGQVVVKALAKAPDYRFQSAQEFVRALDATGLAAHVVDKLIELVASTAQAPDRDPMLSDVSANRSNSGHVVDEESRHRWAAW
jgi:serine/threonine-protein kinase